MIKIGSIVKNINSGKVGIVIRIFESGSITVLEKISPFVYCTHCNDKTLEYLNEDIDIFNEMKSVL